jgi:hypothetical protein
MQPIPGMKLATQISAVKGRLAQTDDVSASEVRIASGGTVAPIGAVEETETETEVLIVVAAIAIVALIGEGVTGAVTVTDAEVLGAEAPIEEMVVTEREVEIAALIVADVIVTEAQPVKSLLKSAVRSCADSVKLTISPRISALFLSASSPRRQQKTI